MRVIYHKEKTWKGNTTGVHGTNPFSIGLYLPLALSLSIYISLSIAIYISQCD